MSLLKIFKRNRGVKGKKTAEKALVPPAKKVEPLGADSTTLPKKLARRSDENVLRPFLSEKAAELARVNQYVFLVAPNATKQELKGSIARLYRVDVERVRIVRVPGKSVRLGKFEGRKSGYKKAIISIAKGQKIEILPR